MLAGFASLCSRFVFCFLLMTCKGDGRLRHYLELHSHETEKDKHCALNSETTCHRQEFDFHMWLHVYFFIQCGTHFIMLLCTRTGSGNQATYLPQPPWLFRHDIKRGCYDKPRLL